MFEELDESTAGGAAAGSVPWSRITTAGGGRLDYQVIGGSQGFSRRRLLVVEMDAEAASRIEAAIAVLAGRTG